MKRFFLFILSVVGLSVFAQENTIMQSQYQGMTLRRDMTDLFVGESFYGEGSHIFNDDELRSFLSEEAFDDYTSGRKIYEVGNTLKTVGWVLFGAGACFVAYRYIAFNQELIDLIDYPTFWGVYTFLKGIDLFTIGYIIKGIGAGKLDRFLENYNATNANVSFHITPSLIRYRLPQGPSSTALGVSFSVDF